MTICGVASMSIDRLSQLKALHLYGMATAWTELLAEGPRQPMRPEAWLDQLIEAEQADRHVRSLRYQLKAARFPIHRDLTGLDWSETPLPQAQVEQLATGAFMESAHNLILVGGVDADPKLTGAQYSISADSLTKCDQANRPRTQHAGFFFACHFRDGHETGFVLALEGTKRCTAGYMRQVNSRNKKARYRFRSRLSMCRKALLGVADGARTHDNRNHNPGLYQLSYSHRNGNIITL